MRTRDILEPNVKPQARGASTAPRQAIGQNPGDPVHRGAFLGNQTMLRLLQSHGIQPKLTVSQPGDADEVKADRVADKIAGACSALTIHRKCGCATSGSPCAKCNEEEGRIRRKASNSAKKNEVASAEDLTGSLGPGQAMDPAVCEFMETHFGHDLGKVKVHTDSRADTAARSIDARAFTLGGNIVFRKGEYAPESHAGRHLLAHELAHVVQQSRGFPKVQRRGSGSADSGSKDAGSVDSGSKPNEKQPPAEAAGNMAQKPLTEKDKAQIRGAFQDSGPAGQAAPFKLGPLFVLHDVGDRPTGKGKTAAEKSDSLEKLETAKIQENKSVGGTPVGEGPSSYITSRGTGILAHPRFYESDRPTATEFERANDLMEKKDRESLMQSVWPLTDPAFANAMMATYLARFPLTKKQSSKETETALRNFDPSQSIPNNDPGKPAVRTTAAGTAAAICDAVTAKSAAGIAAKGKEPDLEAQCKKLADLVKVRRERIAGSTNLEMYREKGSDCSTDKAKAQPFDPYPSAVYGAAARLYLMAALEAGQFPEITTHYFLDKNPMTKSQNRCDPRCWDLGLLYTTIAAILGHPKGTTYGVDFKPGTSWGTSTVWWFEPVCGAKPGSASGAGPAKPNAPAEKPAKTSAPPSSPPKHDPKIKLPLTNS